MAKERLDHDFFEDMKREHRELIDLLGQIRHVLASGIEDAGKVESLVDDLGSHLRSHFQNEETGGYLHEALERAPRLTNLAEQLQKQHATLLETFEQLCSHVKTESTPGAWWAELRDMFDDFSKRLLKHESQEDALVQDAFNQDIGTGD